MPSTDVFCAFTGSIPDDADLPTDHPLEDDELADLPVAHQRLILRDNALTLFGDRLGISASPTSTSTPRSSSGSAPTVG